MKIKIVANPAAGRGLLKKTWPHIEGLFKKHWHELSVAFTTQPGDGVLLTRQALHDGYDFIVGIGGDGSLNECVNGFFEHEKLINPEASLGILPYGRGSDLARSLDLPRKPEEAIIHLSKSSVRLLDVGKVTFLNVQGPKKVRYFLNNAYMGLGVMVDHFSHDAPKFIGPTGAYMYGVLRGFLGYKPLSLVYTNKKVKRESTVMNMVIANGPYFGSGMKAAPFAETDDGAFDVVVIKTETFPKLLAQFPRLYTGQYMKDDNIDYIRAKYIEVYSKDEKIKAGVDVDGDPAGNLPAIFEVLPKAIRFRA